MHTAHIHEKGTRLCGWVPCTFVLSLCVSTACMDRAFRETCELGVTEPLRMCGRVLETSKHMLSLGCSRTGLQKCMYLVA